MKNVGYMLYIQTCAKFWNDPQYRNLKRDLQATLSEYQFLGICAVMWSFVKPANRRHWTEQAIKGSTGSKLEIAELAQLTIKTIK
jgi:hypothetical protein